MEDIKNLSEEEIDKLFLRSLTQFLEDFKDANIRRIDARYCIDRNSFYIDYSAIQPGYSKETATKALEIFKKHSNTITMYLDVLKLKHPNIEYHIGKTIVSSARIGKTLDVYNLPFIIPYDNAEYSNGTITHF